MDIIVVGHVKSGNTWLARLLADAIDCPIRGWTNKLPIAAGRGDRLSKHVVRQLHLVPGDCEGELVQGKYLCMGDWNREEVKVVHVVRDPRDVTVSAMYYWEIPSLEQALTCVGEGQWPLSNKWQEYVMAWKGIVPVVRYKDLHSNPEGELIRILSLFGLRAGDLDGTIHRQSFQTQRSYIRGHGGNMPYGKKIQLKNLRMGIVGDWKAHFLEEDEIRAERYFGEAARQFGFMEEE